MKDDTQLKMGWEERGLFAMSLDYLWRCILHSQDKILTKNDQTLKDKIKSFQSNFDNKLLRLTKELEYKDKQLKSIHNEYKSEIEDLKKQLDNAVRDKQNIRAVADERYFDLKCVRNDADIVALKTYYRRLDENMMLAINEKQPQIEACQKLINIMRKMIPSKDKDTSLKLTKFRLRRRKRKTGDTEAGIEDEADELKKDVILLGKGVKLDEPTAVDELLDYLYEQYSDLFVINGETKDGLMLSKEAVLRVLDDIPEDLLEKLLVPPPKDSCDIELQTVLTLNP